MKDFRVGIIGCGTIAPIHYEAIKQLEGVTVTAVCDLDEASASDLISTDQVDIYKDYQVLLDSESIDLVHILLPHYLHVPVAIEALEKGKHVILEKPVGITKEEIQLLNEKAKASDSYVGVIFQNRYNPWVITLKDLVDSGDLGELISSKAVLTWSRPDAYYDDSPWRGSKELEGGGLLINQAIHTLDLMRYIGGEIESISASVANHIHDSIEVEDIAMATIHYKNGAKGSFFATNNYGDNSPLELAFMFEKATCKFSDQALKLIKDQKVEVLVSEETGIGEKWYWGKSHIECISSIYHAISDQRPLEISLEDASSSTQMVLTIYESSQLNSQKIKL